LFPCDIKPQQQSIWILAEQFGAICYETFDEKHITHVIANNVCNALNRTPKTKKTRIRVECIAY
jgi:hypothetical protein